MTTCSLALEPARLDLVAASTLIGIHSGCEEESLWCLPGIPEQINDRKLLILKGSDILAIMEK